MTFIEYYSSQFSILHSVTSSVFLEMNSLGFLAVLFLYLFENSVFYKPRMIGGSDCKESARNAGDLGSIHGLGRAPGGGHGNPLQYSCLENLHGQRSLAGYSPWGCKESGATERLNTAQSSVSVCSRFYEFLLRFSLAFWLKRWLLLSLNKVLKKKVQGMNVHWRHQYSFILKLKPKY